MNFNLSLFSPGKKEQQGQPGESKCNMCNKPLCNMFLKNIICLISNHIHFFALVENPAKIFHSMQ